MRLFVLFILLISLVSASAQIKVADYDANARVQILLQQARAAIGHTNIQTLSARGKIRRTIKYVEVSSPTKVEEKEKVLTSNIAIDFLLPDKFRIRQKVKQINGFDYEFLSIVNGHESWVYPLPVVPSTRENRRVVSVEDAEKVMLAQAQMARINLSRFTLICLLQPLPAFPFEFSYAGIITNDGQNNEVILVRDVDGAKTLLLLDPVSRLPVMLNETVITSPSVTVIPTGFGFDRRYNRALITKVREERQARRKPAQPISIQMRLSDRRLVDGMNFPHRITTLNNGQQVEEIEFDEFEINRPINPKKFEEKRPNPDETRR